MPNNRFLIRNDRSEPLTLCVEPEGAFFPLGNGEEVAVTEEFKSLPVSVTIGDSDSGELIVSIWPGDGEMRVQKDGVDVFDLLARPRVSA